MRVLIKTARRVVLCAIAILGSSLWSQDSSIFQPLGAVKTFLQLTDLQVQLILSNNEQFNRWATDKQNRISQVQAEIGEETEKPFMDPNAIGIRYFEIEAICRALAAQATVYQAQNANVLTPPQKAKLRVLEDAVKLIPLMTEAQNGNLLGSYAVAPAGFVSTFSGFGTGFASGITGAYGCQRPGVQVALNIVDQTSRSLGQQK